MNTPSAASASAWVAIACGAACVAVGLFRGETAMLAAGAGLLGGPAVVGKKP